MLAIVDPVFATSNLNAPGFWQQNTAVFIAAALTGLLGVLIGTGVGFWQWRQSHRAKQELERTRLEWEHQRLGLEDRIARDRITWEERQRAAARRAEAEGAVQARLRVEAERADNIERQAIAYREALIGELRNLKILDMTKPLDLEALYVQLQVREEDPPRYIKDEDVATLARGDPEQLLRLSQVRLGERAALALTPEDAFRRFNRIAVLGDPGAGKTTMLRHLAFRIAREEFVGAVVLPVYVELRRFIDSRRADLLDFAVSEWRERYGFVGAISYLEQELASGRAALLLDGLDEVLGGETAEAASAAYNRVAREIDRLATRFPNAPIAVTCRRAGWRGKLPAFQTLEVLDFSWNQIQTFLKNWFSEFPAKAEDLRGALAGNLRMQTFAANPLMLSLIAIVYERELELPERRAQLYNRCAEVLLKEWDSHREVRRFARFTTDRKRDLLEEVAWHFHRRGLRYFPKSELLELIADFLPTIDLPDEDAAAILDEIAAHYGLLKVQAHDWYGFLHLTMQEYFVALAANERGAPALDEVARHRHDPWWEEVILLLAGRMADATPLLMRILGREESRPPEEGEHLAAHDDLFHMDLNLAARCLVGTPRIRAAWLRERIVSEMRQLLRTARYRLDYEHAARVLTHMNSEATTSNLLGLVRDKQVDADRKRAIINAFGRYGDPNVAVRLLNLLRGAAPLDESLETSVAEALGTLRYGPAFPMLLQMLNIFVEHLPEDVTAIRYETDLDKGARLVTALGALADPIVIPSIMIILRKFAKVEDDFVCRPILAACLEALESLDDDSVAPELIELLNNVKWASAGPDLVKAIGSIAEANGAAPLLTALLNDAVYGPLKPAIARTLRDLKQVKVVPTVLEALRDRERPWEIRWLLTETLEGCQEPSVGSLAAMLEEPELNERVRVGIATTLGTWKEALGLPYLRAAIEGNLLPGDLTIAVGKGRTYTYRSYFWHRMARVLRSFDDDWIVPSMIARLDSILPQLSLKDPLPGEVWTILSALADDPPEAIGDRILNLITKGSGAMYESPWEALVMVFSKPLVPKAIALLEKHQLVPRTRDDMVSLLSSLGKIADDSAAAESLLNMLLNAEEQGSPFASAYHEALYNICRRARVRAFTDGRVRTISLVV